MQLRKEGDFMFLSRETYAQTKTLITVNHCYLMSNNRLIKWQSDLTNLCERGTHVGAWIRT
jgi:hypothetical protein